VSFGKYPNKPSWRVCGHRLSALDSPLEFVFTLTVLL